MKKYPLILSALSICPIDLNLSSEEYKLKFQSFIQNSDSNFLTQVRTEIEKACQDPDMSWKSAAQEVDFYAFHFGLTEKEILKEIKWLMWDTVFPDD